MCLMQSLWLQKKYYFIMEGFMQINARFNGSSHTYISLLTALGNRCHSPLGFMEETEAFEQCNRWLEVT